MPLFLPIQEDDIPLPQGSAATVSRPKMARWFIHFGYVWTYSRCHQPYKKLEQTLVPTKLPHTHTHTWVLLTVDADSRSHPAAAASAAELLLARISWGSRVPPPAEALHLSIQSCVVFITISHLSDHCKALGDSENKAMHTHRASKILQP